MGAIRTRGCRMKSKKKGKNATWLFWNAKITSELQVYVAYFLKFGMIYYIKANFSYSCRIKRMICHFMRHYIHYLGAKLLNLNAMSYNFEFVVVSYDNYIAGRDISG